MSETGNETKTVTGSDDGAAKRRIVVRLPGFMLRGEVGLGDMVGKAAKLAGAEPCDDCKRRRDAMNRRLIFRGGA